MIRGSEETGTSRVASKRKDFSADQCIFVPQRKCASTRLSVAACLPLLMAGRKMQPIDGPWRWSDFPAVPHGNGTGHSRHCLRRILVRHFEEAVPRKAVVASHTPTGGAIEPRLKVERGVFGKLDGAHAHQLFRPPNTLFFRQPYARILQLLLHLRYGARVSIARSAGVPFV